MDRRTRLTGLLATALSATLPGGCTADPRSYPAHTLAGPWSWIGSAGGITGIRPTPGSEGSGLTFVFRTDGGLDIYRDGALAQRARFELRRERTGTVSRRTTLHYADPLAVFGFAPHLNGHYIRRMVGDTLILTDPCCDRYEHTFVRLHH